MPRGCHLQTKKTCAERTFYTGAAADRQGFRSTILAGLPGDFIIWLGGWAKSDKVVSYKLIGVKEGKSDPTVATGIFAGEDGKVHEPFPVWITLYAPEGKKYKWAGKDTPGWPDPDPKKPQPLGDGYYIQYIHLAYNKLDDPDPLGYWYANCLSYWDAIGEGGGICLFGRIRSVPLRGKQAMRTTRTSIHENREPGRKAMRQICSCVFRRWLSRRYHPHNAVLRKQP